MDTEGLLAPATAEEAVTTFEELLPAAETVVRETARAMADGDPTERVAPEVVATAHEALFASLLTVRVGTAEEFADWRAEADVEVTVNGSDNVDNVVWHVAPFADRAVAATYQEERAAAVGTLRRQAFAALYRDLFVEGA